MTEIAVVGLACRYPGAPDADAFWRLLRDGREGLTRFTDAELADRGVPATLRRNRSYVPVGGLIAGQEEFDPDPFGISETEAPLLDPQVRVFLECAWHALEHAGHAGGETAGSVGVYAGAALSGYLATNLAHRFDPLGGADPAGSLALHTGNVADYLPLHVAYRLGLTGPTVSVGATCATSLVAVHLAVQALAGGECDTALAGGVSLRVPQGRGYLAVPDGPFSTDGRTRSYAAGATGTVFTQGAGVVVLRRLADALADGDHIHAVILGSAVGNDGPARAGFAAPSATGQARVIAEALAVADTSPAQISYVEGHGTGTVLGDPIEVRALREVFGPAVAPWCGLGSVKGNIGHADSAAGVGGLIKAVLALREGLLPASLHADDPNPALELPGSAFELVTEARAWSGDDRRAGVSSFGIGGVDCHVVLAAAPTAAPAPPDDRPQLLLVSAATPAAGKATAAALADHLAQPAAAGSAGEPVQLAEVAHTLAVGRAMLPHRIAVAAPPAEAAAALAAASTTTMTTPARLVCAFSGGGSQFAGVGRLLYAQEPVFAATVDELAEAFGPRLGVDLRADVRAAGDDPAAVARARDPKTGLPLLFTVSVATWALLRHWGVRPDVVLGHSVGEYAAAVAAGALDLSDAAALVAERSLLMAGLPAGSMLAVPLPEEQVIDLLGRYPTLDIAAVNATDACAVAGPADAVRALRDELTGRGLDARLVGVDVAAHSRLVEPAMPALARAAAGLSPKPAETPLVTTITGQFADPADLADPQRWVRHLRAPVRFGAALDTAVGDGPALVVQVGPGALVASLAARRGRSAVPAALTTLGRADDEPAGRAELLGVLGQLWQHGVPIDHAATLAVPRRRTPLPGYAFSRRRFWVDPQPRVTGHRAPGEAAGEPSAAAPLQLPTWRQLPPLPSARLAGQRWLVVGPQPYAAQLEAALRVAGAEPATQLDADTTGVLSLIGLDGGPADERVRRAVDAYGELAQASAGADEPLALVQVTVDAEAVDGAETVDPVAAAVRGLPRVLGQELPRLRWRCLDLRSVDAAAVLAEAADLAASPQRRCWEVAGRAGRRWLREWQSWQPDAAPELPAAPVALITGGLGSVGLAVAEAWCGAHDATVVLLGRTDLAAAPAPRQEAVARLRAAGARVETHACDVTDTAALAAAIAGIVAAHGRLDLVIHAPVVVALAGLAERDDATTAAVLAPKVKGVLALRAALRQTGQRPTVLLASSAAGTIGGFGLGAYVAASRFLDAMAAAEPGWTAIDFDRWRFGTAAEAESAAEITMRHALDAADALTALTTVAALGRAGRAPDQVAASPAALNERATALPARTVSGPVTGGAALTTAAQRLIAQVWSEALGRTVDSADDDFFALGGHSLLATRVLATLRDAHGVQLRLRDLLTCPTVAALAALLPQRLDSAAQPAPTATPETAPALDADARPAATAPFPLTRVQHAYRVGRSDDYALGSVGCHFYLEHECAELDVPRYERVWNAVIARHPMLRAVVTADGQNLVLPTMPRYRVPVTDLRGHEPDQASAELNACRERLSHRVADPTRWPLIVSEVVHLPDGTSRLLLSVDVLVCDSASYLILDRELCALYRDPDVLLPPIGVDFADCVAALEQRRTTEGYAQARRYWTARELPPAPPLPVHDTNDGPPRFRRLAGELPAEAWQRLCQRATDVGATPTAALLAAYATALARWSGSDHFSLTLTVFDRPAIHPDVDNVVGEFSSLLLHEVDHRRPATFADRVRHAQRLLFDDLDHREYGGLELLAELARHGGHQGNVPVVFTGMLGIARSADGIEHDHEWLGPVVHGVSQTPQVWLDHQVFTRRGALALQWDVNTAALDPADAATAFADYVDLLTELSAPEHTWDGPAAPRPAATAAPATRDPLRGIWADLLGRDDIADDATFVSLGGDSLLAVRMTALVRQRLGVELSLPEIRSESTLTELAVLLDGRAGGAGPVAAGLRLRRRPDPEAPFPLLPLQQAYFVGQQGGWELSYDSAHYYTDVALSGVDADRAPGALTDAVGRMMAHQPMLRARVLPDGSQRILSLDDPAATTAPVSVVDLRDAADDDVRDGLAAVRERMGATGPDPQHGPGFAIGLTLLPGGAGRLHVAFSLLTADGWSAQIFARELLAYLADPNAVHAPLLIDFGDYVTTVTEAADRPEWRADRQWWTDRLADLPAAPALPLAAEPASVTVHAMGGREARLPAASWARLRAQCATHGVTPSAALAAGYAVAVAGLAGHRRFLMNTLQFSRHPLHPDVDRMIGAFSATALVPVELRPGWDFAAAARAVQEQITESLAHQLTTGVEVSRELARLRGSHRPVAPVVFQSTLGLNAALGGALDSGAGPLGRVDERDHTQFIRTPQVLLELRLYEVGEELVLSLASVDEVFAAGDLDRLFAGLTTHAHALADPAAWSAALPLPDADDPPATLAAGRDSAHEAGPPRPGLEQEIADLWRPLLGVPPTDRAADFFALGGDSLSALRMLRRVAADRAVAVPPARFLADPTIAGLAAALTASPSPSTPDPQTRAAQPQGRSEVARRLLATPRIVDDIVVPLRDGAGAPLVLLHPSGGDVRCYAELARSLVTERPVLALTDPELAGHRAPDGIDALTELYGHAVRRHAGDGPYLLGGWSMGGTVAHHLAGALRRDGASVDLVVMIDANSPERIIALEGLDQPRTEAELHLRYLRSIEAFLELGLPDDLDTAGLTQALTEAGLMHPNDGRRQRLAAFSRHLRDLADHHAVALDDSVPVVLLRADDPSPRNARIGMGVDDAYDEPDLGWGPYCPRLRVHRAPGHHYSIIHSPELAPLVSAALPNGA
ncbi:SDR family NAD(P)-dependent oxidoreductase [Pilimelia columellifera]|uniref:Acyl transferase domain-containing protein n=1 Tax=Pilimelia columellifera subsp. columellifera TaxID=706583 RepID=A0ABP6AWU2_9ACTN